MERRLENMEIWEFKVMEYGRFFETGSMTGLMTLFRRHSRIMTNFSIFEVESRPYWCQYGCGSARCAEGPVGLECLAGHGTSG